MALTPQQRTWVLSATERRIVTVELEAHGDLEAVTIATETWSPTGGPIFDGRIIGDWTMSRQIGSVITGGGVSRIALGNIVVGNADADLPWVRQDWKGRPVTVRWGDPEWLDISDHIIVYKGFVSSLEGQGLTVEIVLSDARDERLQKLLPQERYTADDGPDAIGELKPYALGGPTNAPVVLLDSAELKYGVMSYMVNPGDENIKAVRDNGVLLTENVDWEKIDADPTFVKFQLDNAIGQITSSFRRSEFTWQESVDTLLLDAGFSIAEAVSAVAGLRRDSGTDWDNVDAATQLWSNTPRPAIEYLDQLAASIGVVMFPDREGTLKGVVMESPTVAPVHTFSQDEIEGQVESSRVSDPVESLQVGLRQSWSRQSVDALSPGLSAEEKKKLTEPFAWVTASSNTQLEEDNVSDDEFEPIETLITAFGVDPNLDGDPDFEHAVTDDIARWLGRTWQTMLSVPRRRYRAKCLQGAGLLELGEILRLQHNQVGELSPLVDHNGEAIVDENAQPIEQGIDGVVHVLDETFPSGAVTVEVWH